jgi:hypothetical protein
VAGGSCGGEELGGCEGESVELGMGSCEQGDGQVWQIWPSMRLWLSGRGLNLWAIVAEENRVFVFLFTASQKTYKMALASVGGGGITCGR